MPFFGRKKAEPTAPAPEVTAAEPLPPPDPTGELACEHPYCNRHDGVRCDYRDRRGNVCQTQWCPDHYHLVGEAPYCRRHVAIARALAHQGSGLAAAPNIDNRAPSLCEWVAAAIDERITGMIVAAGAAYPGSKMLSDPLELVLEGTPRMRSWERSWKLVDHTGPLAKVTIRVSEENDREVVAMVGRESLASIVPPWVDRTASDDAGRETFYEGIVETLSRGFEAYLATSQASRHGYLPG